LGSSNQQVCQGPPTFIQIGQENSPQGEIPGNG
jgi:hypothetical protein